MQVDPPREPATASPKSAPGAATSPQPVPSTSQAPKTGSQPALSPAATIVKSASPAVSPTTAKREPDIDLLALPSHDRAYYYSASDDDSDRDEADFVPPQVTNRGNKLRRGARDVRRGRLAGWPKFGAAHEEAVRKRMRIDLTPTLSLQSRRSALDAKPRLPPPPRNPVELMTSPAILRTFAAKQSHLPPLALAAVNLIEHDAALLKVLGRVTNIVRGDDVPFVDERVREVEHELRAAIVARREAAEAKAAHEREARAAAAARSAAAIEAAAAATTNGGGDEPMADVAVAATPADELAPPVPDAAAPPPVAVDGDVQPPLATGDSGDMDVDANGDDPDFPAQSRSTSPDEASRRRSRRGAAAKASAANLSLSRERSPSPELVEPDDEEEQPPANPDDLLPAELGEPGWHLPPSLRLLTHPDGYVRSLFITESEPIALPGVQQPLGTDDQLSMLQQSLTELQRFLADTIEYQERLGEIRDGALGVERRRKGLHHILRVLCSDYLDYEAAEQDRQAALVPR